VKRRAPGFIAAFLFVGLGGCATVLGLDGYEDAATALCGCPGFEKVEACAENAHARLSAATSAERQAWLAAYEAKQCGSLCESASVCYGEIPGCAGVKPGCECCAWNDVVLTCTSGTCQACRTCSELALLPESEVYPCVSSRAKLVALVEKCACKVCTDDCAGLCQKIDPLSDNLQDSCRSCVEMNCKGEVDACLADKP